MIDRYSRPAMKQVWSDENKYRMWLDVELAVCEAWTEAGVVPLEDMELLRGAAYNHARMMEIFETTRHDVTAFLRSITETLGPEGRWLHLGMTSSDMLDTGQALQLVAAGDLLLQEIDAAIAAVKDQAIRHKDTLMMGRTHGVHAEPMTFGLKLALWWDELRRQRERMQAARDYRPRRQDFRRRRHPRHHPAPHRDAGLLPLGAGSCARLQPGGPARPARPLHHHLRPGRRVPGKVRHRDSRDAAHRNPRGRRALRRRANRLLLNAPQAQSGADRTHLRPGPHHPRQRRAGPGKRRPLGRERDISHSSSERIILPDTCLMLDYILSIFTHVISGLRVDSDRMWQNLESSRGLIFSQRVLLALVEEKGLSREAAYDIVQRNAMRAWDDAQDFRHLLKADPEASEHLTAAEMDELFDYGYYTRYIDDNFERIGLLPAAVLA